MDFDTKLLVANLDLQVKYKVYRNVITMMRARGFIPKFKPKTKTEYISHALSLMTDITEPHEYMDKLVNIFVRRDPEPTFVMVYYHCLDIKFKKTDMEYIIQMMEEKKVDKTVIIIHDKVNAIITNTISSMEDTIQLFSEDELMIDITKHAFVPKFYKLSDQEKQDLVEYYNTPEKNFPAFFHKDAIVRYYDWKIGDMIRIERNNGTNNPDLYYRIVC